ncbi:hypothetical protein QUF54_08130 [Candidatus Marithioploca araucensis]|uniref:Uncharacterized protein n=1 Tax=Candidatus Marithioploca araucensis TaxID=70273 RepID=A0ABT7VUR0_9GAMM|nr:hypothetical protein [Candidatus Marithioploca araucensis]
MESNALALEMESKASALGFFGVQRFSFRIILFATLRSEGNFVFDAERRGRLF